MDRTIARIVALLGGLAAVLAGVASTAGVLLRGDLATTDFVTVRGEVVPMVTDGIYRFNAEGLVAEGIGWDIVTLFVAVPATLVALALLTRGSLRAALVSAGLLAYLVYQSAQYGVYWALGPLFPVYVATLAASVSALGLLLYGLESGALRVRAGWTFPRRAVVGYSVAVVVLLAGLWVPVLARTLGQDVVDELQGASTLVVPVFDLGLLVPLAIFTGLSVYHRLPVGYVLGSVLLVKGATMALAISAMLVVEFLVTDVLALPPLVIFAVVAVFSLAVGLRALRSFEDDPAARQPGQRAVQPPSTINVVPVTNPEAGEAR